MHNAYRQLVISWIPLCWCECEIFSVDVCATQSVGVKRSFSILISIIFVIFSGLQDDLREIVCTDTRSNMTMWQAGMLDMQGKQIYV